ncbi:hypothetical protein [Nocardia noduli]|uniref:hypothetical protein n=1 Tax=Nocardia noduli TaxID=2815722 RepID=UPI001C216632|nr:hypothetical protein [Nocardia noduli]
MTATEELLAKLDCSNTDWPGSNIRAAHHAMQVHLECVVGECAAKTTAHSTLVDSGKLKPDSGRTR